MQAPVRPVVPTAQMLPHPQQAGVNFMARSWHMDPDVLAIRRQITSNILELFKQRQHGGQAQWNDRLPSFVKRLEEALFKSAQTKDDYANLGTLEDRLQRVARCFQQRPPHNPPMNNGMQGYTSTNPLAGTMPTGMMQTPQQTAVQTSMQGMAVSAPQMMHGSQFPGMAPSMQHPAGMGFGGDGNMAPLRNNAGAPGMMPSPGMIPTDNSMSSVPNSGYGPTSSNMLPGPSLHPPPGYAATIMSNGAPVLLRNNAGRDWGGLQSPQMNPQVAQGAGVSKVLMNGNAPLVPAAGNMVPVASSISSATGMIPTKPASPMGNGPVGMNMVPVNQGMVPVAPSGTHIPPNTFANSVPPNRHLGGQGPPQGVITMDPRQPSGVEGQDAAQRQHYIQKQQRWLLFLRHCAKCQQTEDQCQFKDSCKVGKDLWKHILGCQETSCPYPRCGNSRDLLKHHQKCLNAECPICTPVKEYVKKARVPHPTQPTPQFNANPANWNSPFNSSAPAVAPMPASSQMLMSNTQPPGPSAGQKRPAPTKYNGIVEAPMRMIPVNDGGQPAPLSSPASIAAVKVEHHPAKRVKTEEEPITAKNTGTSLLETFTSEQINIHMRLLVDAMQQQRASQAPPANPEDACSVCGVTKLAFEPPCIYCVHCGQKIKRGQTYYSTSSEYETKGCWCHGCYTDQKGDKVLYESMVIRKADLQKKKNDEETEEYWVQCDACEAWVHQICGLFNKGRNDKDVHYLCPRCLIQGLERGERQRIEMRPQAMLEAKDLPQCNLSMLLEKRVVTALQVERVARAKAQGKPVQEIPTAEGMTIRVINNVQKRCEVKPKFGDTFAQDGYPSEFPYRQKVILLMQNLDGVDVCLFCMYVQEYGEDCPPPNQKCVYLSYIDSVRYFQPENVQACGAGNVSLRTYVYHQILIGYLDYVKRLGFEQMYIWACPPLQGDDYILYCHPAKQKTPRSDRLRAWYHDMLRKAKDEGIVVHISTLWDTYFEGGRDHRMEKPSATHIPYLEGDYWPGEAENLLANIQDQMRQEDKKGKRGGGSNTGGRKPSAKGKRYNSGVTTDEQLMNRLGEILGGNMKEDFIVVHLQEPCTFCRKHVNGGSLHRYHVPPSGHPLPKPPPERRFEGIKLESPTLAPSGPVTHLQLCDQCYSEEMGRYAAGARTRMPNGLQLTDLVGFKAEHIPAFADPDGDVESEFFVTRQAFLSLCQGNHYQFDTLRRAKHSSMMVLYHLHNPSEPAFACTCNACGLEIEPGQGFRCTVCADFDMCAKCKAEGKPHEHPLTAHAHKVDETRTRLTDQQRQERSAQLQRTMALLVHACSCSNSQCGSTSCRKVHQLFQHAVQCKQKVTGGCHLCKRMWGLLNLHAKSCNNSNCPVPRCKELKELRRRQTARKEAHRRELYLRMLRQQQGGASGSQD